MRISIIKKREYPELAPLYEEFDVVKNGDICVAVGGDGTFIKAAAEFEGPILPIRTDESGSIGYYSDLSIGEIGYVIDNLKRGKYTLEKLSNKMEVEYRGRRYLAINEIVLNNLLEEVSFRIYELEGGRRYEIYPYVMSGDGMLVTGLVGSTAYNKSAGGPIILSPDVFCMTFLNVDGPYKNPIVVDARKRLEIEIIKYKGRLKYDGKEIGVLGPGARFRVSLSRRELRVVRFSRRERFGSKLDRIIRSRMQP
jgi:NAD+ kinase